MGREAIASLPFSLRYQCHISQPDNLLAGRGKRCLPLVSQLLSQYRPNLPSLVSVLGKAFGVLLVILLLVCIARLVMAKGDAT